MARSQQWKTIERQLAKDMGGERTGPRGLGLPDVQHPDWAPECKYGEPRWINSFLRKTLDQAKTNARGKPWFLYLHEKGRGGEKLVVIPYEYFLPLIRKEHTDG